LERSDIQFVDVLQGKKAKGDVPMLNMAKLALAGALVFGAATAVQASERDPADQRGGYRIGPLGQHFGGVNPAYHRSMRHGYGVYADVPGDNRFPSRHYRGWNWNWDWDRYWRTVTALG
jgi:hypothetical protein